MNTRIIGAIAVITGLLIVGVVCRPACFTGRYPDAFDFMTKASSILEGSSHIEVPV
jgi:hypothetical protein